MKFKICKIYKDINYLIVFMGLSVIYVLLFNIIIDNRVVMVE